MPNGLRDERAGPICAVSVLDACESLGFLENLSPEDLQMEGFVADQVRKLVPDIARNVGLAFQTIGNECVPAVREIDTITLIRAAPGDVPRLAREVREAFRETLMRATR